MRATKYGDIGESSWETSRRRLEVPGRVMTGSTCIPSRVSKTALRVLQCVHEFHQEHGFSPSMREIAEAVGLKSSASVNYHVCALTYHGLLHRIASAKYRAMSITASGLQKIGAE